MKHIFTAIALVFANTCLAQNITGIDTSSKAVDSMFEQMKVKLTIVREIYGDVPEFTENYVVKIKPYKKDSIAYLFHTHTGTLVLKVVDEFSSTGCRFWQRMEIYSATGKIYYKEGWRWRCPEDTEEEAEFFTEGDSLLREMERFYYDEKGRLKARKWWVDGLGLQEYTYHYEPGKEPYTVKQLPVDQFWY